MRSSADEAASPSKEFLQVKKGKGQMVKKEILIVQTFSSSMMRAFI